MDREFGRYEVIAEVGRGAMGVVYRGRDPLIGRTVAIKAVNRSFLAQVELGASEYLERFRREAQVSGVLDHPNIVKVFDLGPDFMVMEFVEGQSLAALVHGSVPPTVERGLEIVAQIAEALDYAHRHGVVHRDVKPANVMIQTSGQVKVMDFGLARIGGSQLTAAGAVLGSASYMAPEVVMGRPADPRADIFSLGVTAYEVLAGDRPFPGKSISMIINNIIREPPRPISELGLPAEWDPVFEVVLAKDPERRYQTAMAFVEALGARAAGGTRRAEGASQVDAGGQSMVVLEADEVHTPPGPKPPEVEYVAEREPVRRPLPPPPPVPAQPTTLIPNPLRAAAEARPAPARQAAPHPRAAASAAPWIAGGVVLLAAGIGLGLLATRRGPSPPPIREGDLVAASAVTRPAEYLSGDPVSAPALGRGVKPATVLVEFTVDERGETHDLKILDSGGEALDEACRRAVLTWRYRPAMAGDVRVKVRQQFQFNFKPPT